jgi:hypothetical protein
MINPLECVHCKTIVQDNNGIDNLWFNFSSGSCATSMVFSSRDNFKLLLQQDVFLEDKAGAYQCSSVLVLNIKKSKVLNLFILMKPL